MTNEKSSIKETVIKKSSPKPENKPFLMIPLPSFLAGKPRLLIVFCIIILIFAGAIISITRLLNNTGFAWCKPGNSLKLEDAVLTAVSIENYQSPQYEDKVCHLTYTKDTVSSDYYLDEAALTKFRGSKDINTGNGCIVYKYEKRQTGTELCFGSKVKDTYEVEKKGSLSEALKEFENKITPLPSISSTANLRDTKWRYRIDVGGGVGGVLTFEKDENGSLSGTFTEFGPEGKKEKSFIGSYEKDNFLLTLEEFPTFKVVLSPDNKMMTGKPVEQEKDIFYPDDFFSATRE